MSELMHSLCTLRDVPMSELMHSLCTLCDVPMSERMHSLDALCDTPSKSYPLRPSLRDRWPQYCQDGCQSVLSLQTGCGVVWCAGEGGAGEREGERREGGGSGVSEGGRVAVSATIHPPPVSVPLMWPCRLLSIPPPVGLPLTPHNNASPS